MIDFFHNLPEVAQEKKLKGFNVKVGELEVSKSEITDLRNVMAGGLRMTLPKQESHKIQQKEEEKPETYRTRRGESTSLF